MRNYYSRILPVFILTLFVISGYGQVNTENITIYRDAWGVPHIHAGTDEELAYGLAWATSEDDFMSVQENLLAVRGRLAEVKGKEGAAMDFIAFALGLNEQVEKELDSQVSPEFMSVMQAYVEAINRFAELHPKQVALKRLFPVTVKDLMAGYMLGMAFIANAQEPLTQIFTGSIKLKETNLQMGSNAIAVSPEKSNNGQTFLAINSHQPLTGPYSWYEAHLINKEVNMYGATFPGGTSLFVGANEYLSWTHTVNHPDLSDVYKLEMNPENKLQYKYDGEWKTLRVRKKKIKVKFWIFKLPVKRTFYWSEYGPTIKTEDGFYSLRMPAMMEMKAAEQWHRMNKAQNIEQFKETLKLQGHAGTNLVYADCEGHIYMISNGLFPYRDNKYNWQEVLPGNTSETNWERKYYPLDSLLQVLDPPSGYVYNSNNSPFFSSAEADNPLAKNYSPSLGYRNSNNNRSLRLASLLESSGKLDYEAFKRIKFDRKWRDPIQPSYLENLNDVRSLDPVKYNRIAPSLKVLSEWDLDTNPESHGATIMALILEFHLEALNSEGLVWEKHRLPEQDLAALIGKAQDHLMKHFRSVEVPLGEFQRHVRGKVSFPVGGTPDVLCATHAEPWKKGRFKMNSGESFIMMVNYDDQKVKIEAVNAYGSSSHKNDPHFTDQMEMFTKQELRPVSLDLEVIKKEAKKTYHPK